MVLTKTQIINFLENKKKMTPQGSIKYYTIGALSLLVSKDIITPEDVAVEFPELG